MRGVYLFSHPANGIRYGDPYYDPFWAEAQDLEMPVAIHVSHTPEFVGHELYRDEDGQGRGPGEIRWFHAMLINGDCVLPSPPCSRARSSSASRGSGSA